MPWSVVHVTGASGSNSLIRRPFDPLALPPTQSGEADKKKMIKEVENNRISSALSRSESSNKGSEIILIISQIVTMMIVNGGRAPIPAHIYILKPSQGLARRILHPAYASRGIYCNRAGICIYRNAGIYALPGGIYGCIHRHSGQCDLI